jgi:hypothetical protein
VSYTPFGDVARVNSFTDASVQLEHDRAYELQLIKLMNMMIVEHRARVDEAVICCEIGMMAGKLDKLATTSLKSVVLALKEPTYLLERLLRRVIH